MLVVGCWLLGRDSLVGCWVGILWLLNKEPSTKNHQQRTKNKEPSTKNKEPSTKNHQQRTKNKEPSTKNHSDASGQKRSENLAEVLDTKAKTPQTFISVGQTNRLYNSIDV
jgi:hypothetical protein